MTTELKPGTPEYQKAYDEEMQRLEAAQSKPEKKPDEAAANTSADAAPPKKADAKADEASTETVAELKARLEKAEKAIRDNKAWGTRNAQEVSRLKKEAEERKHRETLAEDPVLKANPGLEETIKRVAKPAARPTEDDAKASWLDTVARAVPDVETLLADPAFHAKAAEKKTELGGEWDDPIIAIRELSSLRAEHLSQRNVLAAREEARKDFEAKAKKRTAMEVPGGSGGKDQAAGGDDAVKRFQTMSKEEFAKERSRVMGY